MNKAVIILSMFIPFACNTSSNNKLNNYQDYCVAYSAIRSPDDDGPTNIKWLKDSGSKVNGIKEGLWSEYYVDSTSYGSMVLRPGDTTKEILIGQQIGKYVKGKKEGVWLSYYTMTSIGSNFAKWSLYSECKLKNDTLDSLLVKFNHDGDTDALAYYKMGEMSGQYKTYYGNYHPKEVYWVDEYGKHLKREYYRDGRLKVLQTDTTLDHMKHLFLSFYSDSVFMHHRILSETAFMLNDTIIDGPVTDYFPDGKIKSVTQYRRGKKLD